MSLSDIQQLQPRAWSLLARSFAAGRTGSTYLFHGREGTGEWPLALAFAALLNCANRRSDPDNPESTAPCGECSVCRSIAAVNFEGLQVVLPIKTHRSLGEAIDLTNAAIDEKRAQPFGLLSRSAPLSLPIDMAREVKRNLAVKGAPGITRVALFYHMDLMRTQSADALLKLIEEPPPDTVIIMTASRPEMLLPTIRSRSQQVRLERVPEPALIEYLIRACDSSESQAKLVARLSDGVPGLAVEMLDRDDDESGERAVGLLLYRSLFDGSGPETVSQMTEMLNFSDRGQAERLLGLWQSLIRDCAYYAGTGEEGDIVNIDFTTEIKRLSVAFGVSALSQKLVGHIKNTLADMRRNVHIPTALVAMVLKLKADIAAASRGAPQEA